MINELGDGSIKKKINNKKNEKCFQPQISWRIRFFMEDAFLCINTFKMCNCGYFSSSSFTFYFYFLFDTYSNEPNI